MTKNRPNYIGCDSTVAFQPDKTFFYHNQAVTGMSDLLTPYTYKEMVKSKVFEAVQLSEGALLIPALAIIRTFIMIIFLSQLF